MAELSNKPKVASALKGIHTILTLAVPTAVHSNAIINVDLTEISSEPRITDTFKGIHSIYTFSMSTTISFHTVINIDVAELPSKPRFTVAAFITKLRAVLSIVVLCTHHSEA